MDYLPHAARPAGAANAAGQRGAGNLFRVVLVVMVVGRLLTAWFLLRGYKLKDD
jgi:hypothetical protein